MKLKIFLVAVSVALFQGCATSSQYDGEIIYDNSPVCGEVGGEHNTYPSMKELEADGATLVSDGPCYEQ